MNWKLTLSYDGTDFHGWQVQPCHATIQGELFSAIERITGTLNDRTGSFVLQHSGTLTRGAPMQNITVVPDSGSGQLVGITGKLTVIIEGGKHSYEFEYALPQLQ